MLLLLGLPALAIVSDLGSGPMRAFTVLPYLFATLGCYWTGSTRTVTFISMLSLLLLSTGTFLKGADQALFYMNRAQFALTIVICAFITRQAIKSRIATVQQSLATTLADLSVGLAIFDGNRRLTFANAAFQQVAPEKQTSDSGDVSLQSLLHALPTAGQDAEIKAWLLKPILPGGADTGPLDLRFTDGRFYQVHAQRLESGQIAVLFHDISRLKSYQSQAIQASKLALLGELSTSVAHEINQPLSAIQLTCDNIKRHLESGQEVDREFLLTRTERARTALDKARNIVDQLRRFGRNAKEAPTAVDLNESINNALDLVSQQMIAAGIVVELQVPSYSVHVMGHPIQLEQVILNLLANARDAVAEGVEAPCITIALTRDTDSVELRVSDNGPGVPEGMREAIFEAFFTSKEVGKGTGLGLSVSKGIVREFGGSLELDTSSHGATFIVKLPNVPEPSPAAQAA